LKGAEETAFGVWGGLGKTFANAWQSVGKDDYLRAVEFASPVFIETMLKAMRMVGQGGTTPAGKILFDAHGRPIKETPGEGVARAAGFRPKLISMASKEHPELANTGAQALRVSETTCIRNSGWRILTNGRRYCGGSRITIWTQQNTTEQCP
jgi:hypothetical protein